MSKTCSANRTRSVEQSKVMAKQSKSMNAGSWDNHPNERQFLDSLSRFMNESWAAVSQVRERSGLDPQYQMSSTEISKRIGEVSKKLDDKYKEVKALETQKTQLLNKSGSSGKHGPRIAAMRPAPGSPEAGPSTDPRYTYNADSSGAGQSTDPGSYIDPMMVFYDSTYGIPRATSTPAHQDSLELTYSGNYSFLERNSPDSDGDSNPLGSCDSPGCPGSPARPPGNRNAGAAGPTPGAANRTYDVGAAGPTQGAANRTYDVGGAGPTRGAANRTYDVGAAGPTPGAANRTYDVGAAGSTPGAANRTYDQVMDGYTLLGYPKATSTPAHHDGSRDDSYSGNYDIYSYPEYPDWGYVPPVSDSSGSPERPRPGAANRTYDGGAVCPGAANRTYDGGAAGPAPGAANRTFDVGAAGPAPGAANRTYELDSSRSATPRSPHAPTLDSSRSATPGSPAAPSTDGSGGSWNSPHRGAIRTPPPRCPGARGDFPFPRRRIWNQPDRSPQPQQPTVAPRRTPSPAPPVDRGWRGGVNVVTYDHTPSSEYSTEASSVGSPPPPDQGGRCPGLGYSSRSDQSAAQSSSAYSSASSRASPERRLIRDESPPPGFSASPPRASPSPRRGPRTPCRGAQQGRNISQESPPAAYASPPPLEDNSWGGAASSSGYSPRSAYSTGRSYSSGLSSHPDSSRGTASRSWNSRVSSGVSDRSGHQFSPGLSDRSAAEALCHPECLGLPYNYRVGAMRE